MPLLLVKFEELAVKLLMPSLDKNEECFPGLLHTDQYYWGRGHYMMLDLRTLNVVKGTAFLLAVCSCDKGFTKSFIIM